MENPFRRRPNPISRRQNLIGRTNVFDALRRRLCEGSNTAIMGPEGVGKTSFLNCFFNRAGRIRLAQEEGLLAVRVNFPAHLEKEVYDYLTDMLETETNTLDEVDPGAAKRIRTKLEADKDNKTGEARLQSACRHINDEEYRVVLVIDNFENFTASQNINMSHHAVLRDLKDLVLYVVATNYDLDKDSLPPEVSGSLFMMLFSKSEMPLDGFSDEECRDYLEKAGAGDCFSDSEITMLLEMSGGIPALLQLTAEAAWDQKQLTPVLDENAWREISNRLYNDPLVREYMTRWCRSLTENQVATINKILDPENPLGSITGQTSTSVATVLHNRRLLKPLCINGQTKEGCYRFNSILLMDYCFNNPLSASDPHDIQKYNITQQLQQLIEDGKKEEVLSLLQSLCASMGNVTMPIDFDQPLTNDILGQYELSTELLERFAPEVRTELEIGIQTERTYINVEMKDYAPVYICFAKAIEAHLNEKLIPLLKKIAPNHPLPKGRTLGNYPHNLMLGAIESILSYRYEGTQTTFCKNAAKYCADRGHGEYGEEWWNKLRLDMKEIQKIRNGMPHTTPLSGEDGIALLRILFSGSEAFMLRCIELHDTMANATTQAPVPQPAIAQPAATPAAAPATAPQLQVGTVVTGTVVGMTSYAAFVNIGASRDAFLHKNEIRDGHVFEPRDELAEGQQIRVKITNVDTLGRITLTMRGIPQA